MSLSSCPADVDKRVSAKRGIVEVEPEPSWLESFFDRVDQRLHANGRRIESQMNERLGTNERRIEQVLGLHQARLDKHDAELGSQRQLLEDLSTEINFLRKSGVDSVKQNCDSYSDSSSTVSSFTPAEWSPKTVVVRGWALFGCAASQKIDRIEYKRSQTNCFFVCRWDCKTTWSSVPHLLQITRSRSISKMPEDGSLAAQCNWRWLQESKQTLLRFEAIRSRSPLSSHRARERPCVTCSEPSPS